MMITPTFAARQPETYPAEWTGNPQQYPGWVGFPSRTNLPVNLINKVLKKSMLLVPALPSLYPPTNYCGRNSCCANSR